MIAMIIGKHFFESLLYYLIMKLSKIHFIQINHLNININTIGKKPDISFGFKLAIIILGLVVIIMI